MSYLLCCPGCKRCSLTSMLLSLARLLLLAGNLAVDDYDMGSGSEDSAMQHLDSHSEHSSGANDASESPQPEAARVQPKRNAARNKGSLREPLSQEDVWLVEGGELA